MNKRQAKKRVKKIYGVSTPRGTDPRKAEQFCEGVKEIITDKITEAMREIEEKIIRGE